jgi:hypothetical protein
LQHPSVVAVVRTEPGATAAAVIAGVVSAAMMSLMSARHRGTCSIRYASPTISLARSTRSVGFFLPTSSLAQRSCAALRRLLTALR